MNVGGIRRFGQRALLVDAGENRLVHAIAERARLTWPGIEDVVPGHDTVLLTWPDRAPSVDEATAGLVGIEPGRADGARGEVVIPTVYSGDDLAAVASEVGLSVEAVVGIHTSTAFTAAFTGFAPGFAYLVGLSEALMVDRLEEPRPRVPSGSVAVAGEYSAVYPTASPGGWRLLGRTDCVMFDPGRERPALVEAGMTVRFEAVPR